MTPKRKTGPLYKVRRLLAEQLVDLANALAREPRARGTQDKSKYQRRDMKAKD